MYIHELDTWPNWTWDSEALSGLLAETRHNEGLLLGRMDGLGLAVKTEANLETIAADVVKSSEIEGEKLDPDQVRSSVARRLGLEIGALRPADRNVEGIVEMTLDATGNYNAPLTSDRLFSWHAALFPTGRSGMRKIIVGDWRDDADGPMQVVSGPVGKDHVHYEAPPASAVEREMGLFFDWFNSDQSDIDGVLAAGLAHLWFVTVHPFEDGNGRIARAIADMALARSEGSSQRFYSMSTQIRREQNDYYEILERTQKGSMDITLWMEWFLGCLNQAIDGAHDVVGKALTKARFWEGIQSLTINSRQKKVLNLLLDGFGGKLTTSKYAKLTKTSPDTALRDITALIEQGVLVRGPAGGRSTSYLLAGEQPTASGVVTTAAEANESAASNH